MAAIVKTRKKIKLNADKFENDSDILLAENRIKNSESMKKRIPFEQVLDKFNITQQEINNAEEVEFVLIGKFHFLKKR